jgi:Lrp/AsnC family leucine-responsive transcriptional regulator
MAGIDKVDKRILFELHKDARISDSELAKKVRRSKDSVRYRIRNLEDAGIIFGYQTWIDFTKIGYSSYKLYLRLSATPEQAERLYDYIRKEKRAFALFTADGAWSVGLAFFAKNHAEFYDIQNRLLSRFGDIITSKIYCSMADAVVKTRDFLYDGDPEAFQLWGVPEANELDKIERKIIASLFKNSRKTLIDLAADCGTTVDKVRSRLKRLKEKRIIFSHTAKIDYSKLGYEFYKSFVFVKNYDKKSEQKLLGYLEQNNNVIDYIRTVGPWTIEFESMVPNYQEYNNMIRDLRGRFPDIILDIESAIINNEEIHPPMKMIYSE